MGKGWRIYGCIYEIIQHIYSQKVSDKFFCENVTMDAAKNVLFINILTFKPKYNQYTTKNSQLYTRSTL